ncbi:alpha/beta fold hydrolase [Streptomyces sp. NPDC002845]
MSARNEWLYPRSADDFAALREANRARGESCRELMGPLLDHMDTVSVVRDMEAIRAGLGERRISYYGGSYGTLIGQQYADRYPHRVRAMVLDSNMDHSLNVGEYQRTAAVAAEEAFGQFADWCERTPSCALHGRDVRGFFDTLYRRAQASGGLVLSDPTRVISPETLRSTAYSNMYRPSGWPGYAEVLALWDEATADQGSAEPAPRGYGTAVRYPQLPVVCQDYAMDVPSYEALSRLEGELARLAPVVGLASMHWTHMTGCQNCRRRSPTRRTPSASTAPRRSWSPTAATTWPPRTRGP